MEKILRGVLKYKQSHKGDVFKKLSQIKETGSTPSTVLFTCMDARIHPNVFMNSEVGDAFTVRNAGNIVPNSGYTHSPAPEPAGLELGCVINSIKNVVVCGHSDCKAMIAVHSLKNSKEWSQEELRQSPLKAWLYAHGMDSLKKFNEMMSSAKKPLIFMKDSNHEFEAHIDQDLQEPDQLSQINTLVQMENIYTYPFMKKRIDSCQSVVHGLWHCLYSGDVYYFSKKDKTFVCITEKNINDLLSDSR